MLRVSLVISALNIFATLSPRTGAQPKPASPSYPTDVVPLLKAFCNGCHNPSKRKGGLDLESIVEESAAIELTDLWKDVGERLRAKDMPPNKSPQPTADERKRLEEWVTHVRTAQIDYAALPPAERERALASPPGQRRLNRFEYANTLRDLFGLDINVADLLPSEGSGGEGFDNAGATLFITPVLIEKYLEAAEAVLTPLFPPPGAKALDPAAAKAVVAARSKLLVATPSNEVPARSAAKAIFESFLPRAFRRPVTAEELDRHLAVYDKAAGRGDSHEASLRLAIKSVLIAPSFLFLTEAPNDAKGVYSIDDIELASRLSYVLWASMPDDTLLALAAKKTLHEPDVLRGQVRRMLKDPRSRGFADSFGSQWLGIRPLGNTIRPDARTFPDFDAELANAMREETALFLDAIIREDLSVLTVLDADFTFVNERLAKHYGLSGVTGPEMRRVIHNDPARGGILGHGSILTVTSFPHRTSPVLRGRWVIEELLGAEVPPPPPDAPVLNERQKTDTKQTLRQLLETHRAKAECAACHARMDPLGFGLENFDAIGRWRKEVNGTPLDTKGVLPGGETFDGPVELKKILLTTRKADFLRNVSRKMLGYALGREVRKADLLVVNDAVAALEGGEYRVSRLIETIVLSPPFTRRLSPTATTP